MQHDVFAGPAECIHNALMRMNHYQTHNVVTTFIQCQNKMTNIMCMQCVAQAHNAKVIRFNLKKDMLHPYHC